MKRIAIKQRDRVKARLDRLLDDHGAKVLVILLGLLVVVPAGITWRYLTTTADVASEARTISKTNRRLIHEVRALTESVAELQIQTNEALIESCQHNGNSVRRILREEQLAAITPPDDPRLRVLFPSVPLAIVAQFVREDNQRHKERLRVLAPVPCRAQYPNP